MEGWYKVGKAVDADDRCKSYNTSSPLRDYIVEHKVYVKNRDKAEKLAHTLAIKKSKDYSSEWFLISLKDLKNILNSLDSIEKKQEESNCVQQAFDF